MHILLLSQLYVHMDSILVRWSLIYLQMKSLDFYTNEICNNTYQVFFVSPMFLQSILDLHWYHKANKCSPISKYAVSISLCYVVVCCRIWSWSPVPCEKHGPRAMFFTRHGRPWSNPIIARSLIDFFFHFVHRNLNFSALKWAICGSHRGC